LVISFILACIDVGYANNLCLPHSIISYTNN